MRRVLGIVGLLVTTCAGTAYAHTVSIGYANAGPGSVSFWYGTYHDCTELPTTEGSFNLVGTDGTPFPSTTVAFSTSTSTKPAGLIDGTTNFYATDAGPLAPTESLGFPPICWQGVTFNNLQVGTYQFTYIPIADPSSKWEPWNAAVTTNTVTLSQGIVQGAVEIPTLDPSMLVLLALAVAGVGAVVGRRLG